ncbi:MAG: hypothetical protein IT443_08435 [Phycisphaeraceae bacterium]|nr:hypothetical protein [Phycisphaeraceae bacterium]
MPTRLSASSDRVWLASILLLAGLLRLGLFAFGPAQEPNRAYQADSRRYVVLANNLLDYSSFGKAQEDGLVHQGLAQIRAERGELEPADAHGLRPELFRTPGYSVFIAAIQALGLPLIAVLLVQCLLAVAGVWLLYDITWRLTGSRKASLLAAAILALHPADWVAPNTLLSEPLFCFLVLLGLWAAVRTTPNSLSSAGAGLALGAAVLVRPIAIALGPILAIWQFARRPSWHTLALACLMVVANLTPPLLWAARNSRTGAGFNVSTVPPINALYYTVAHMRLAAAGKDLYHDWPAAVAQLHDDVRANLQPGEKVFPAVRRLAMQEIRAHPLLYASVMTQSMLKLSVDHSLPMVYDTLGLAYQPTGLGNALLTGKAADLRAVNWPLAACAAGWMAWNSLLLILALVGTVRLCLRRRYASLSLLLILCAYFAFATQTVGLERFRWPILGLQAVLAAVSLFPPRPASPQAKADKSREPAKPATHPIPQAA